MDIFGFLTLLGGLAMFLFGMDVMGKALERQAGNRLQAVLEKLTSSSVRGFLLGLAATAVIQSSSATTVMVVGFVNSGLMQLHQATGVVLGANVGTTVTAWLLSLTGVEGESLLLQLCKPSSFAPVLAIVGIALRMFAKKDKRQNVGSILLGFAILMFGMETMSGAVKPLANDPGFTQMFTLFSNPILGVLAGTLLTTVIQSSSASVGILQALATTGAVPYSSAIPIIMGQNIGTCATAMISSVGANRSARRVALVHLYFNLISVAVLFGLYLIVDAALGLAFTDMPASAAGIAFVHTIFNVVATTCMLPFTKWLEKLVCLTIPDAKGENEPVAELDERLLNTPVVALEQSRRVAVDMADAAKRALNDALALVGRYDARAAEAVEALEDRLDRYEDLLGTYLVKLSSREMSADNSREAALLLHMIGDFERIGDHAVNLVETARELFEKKLQFSEGAQREQRVLVDAINDILCLSVGAFERGDLELARRVEPLEQVVDDLTKELRSRHIERLQSGACTIQTGFVLTDFLTNCERVADHCSNIAAALIETSQGSFDLHGYTEQISESEAFRRYYSDFRRKYTLMPA